jgi:hypothetical protein
MPSLDGRPILHATDVKFAACDGRNVLCMDEHVDLQRNYATAFGQTGNITTFMSVWIVSILINGPLIIEWALVAPWIFAGFSL